MDGIFYATGVQAKSEDGRWGTRSGPNRSRRLDEVGRIRLESHEA